MQNWTNEMWQVAGLGLVIGLILGYLVAKFRQGSHSKQAETENELKLLQTKLDEKNKQIEQLFADSAERLKNIAQEYQKLYQHLAQSSVELLPEQAQHNLFSQPLEHHIDPHSDNQPRDYSEEGSSGILKAEK